MTEDAVWLDVLPSMDKFGPALAKGADKEAESAGKSAGRKFGLAAAAGVAVIAGGAVLAGKALYSLGETFDEVEDTIRTGTGATGEALDAMVASAKTVSTQVPADFEAIGTAIADVNTRMGLTGPTLEKFSSQVLEAGRLLGEEIDINAVSSAFNVFAIEGEDTTEAMDHLFRVSQATGVGINELASTVSTAAPALQSLGFSFEEAAALAGNLDKAGLNSSKMMAGMSKALVELAKDGEEPQEAFRRTTAEIQGMIESGDKAGAIDLASKLFGTRNATQFIGALETGALAMDDLGAVAGMTEDTILGVGEETMDFAEQWKMFANRMSVLVAPVAEKVFGLIGDGMTWINDNAVPWVEKFIQSFQDGEGPLADFQGVIGGVVSFFRERLLPAFRVVADYIMGTVVPYFQTIAGVVRDTVVPILQDLWAIFNERVLPVLQSVAGFIRDKVIPVVQDFANRVVLPLMKLVGMAIRGMWDNFAKPALESLWDFLKNYLGPAISWLWDNVVSPTFKWIGDAVSGFAENWATTWYNIQSAAAKPVNFVIDVIWNNGLRKALNLIPGIDLAEAKTISIPAPRSARAMGTGGGGRTATAFAGGGILPGSSRYADGDDQLVWMRRGEGVTVTEALDDYERARLLRLNKAVLGGMSPARFRDQFDGHAGGGIVGFRGHRFTELFAATLQAAEAMSGVRFNISQGGFRPRTSYSGTSHQGDAVDILGPITTAVITALRASGVAAWDRTGKGNWAPHIHGVPLPGFGVAGGSAIWQAQDYLRGGDGLGGRDNGPRVNAGEGGLFGIPAMIEKVVTAIQEGLEGPWGVLLREGMLKIIEDVKTWVWDKLAGWGKDLADFVMGNRTGALSDTSGRVPNMRGAKGYAMGTGYAAPGLAWVGEMGTGMPELVEGPQLRMMRGGERVSSSATVRRMLGGGTGNLVLLRGELDLTEDSRVMIRAEAEEVYDDRGSSELRWERMGG